MTNPFDLGSVAQARREDRRDREIARLRGALRACQAVCERQEAVITAFRSLEQEQSEEIAKLRMLIADIGRERARLAETLSADGEKVEEIRTGQVSCYYASRGKHGVGYFGTPEEALAALRRLTAVDPA